MNKIYIKEVVQDNRYKPVDWTLDKEIADDTIGYFEEYSLEDGVKLILDEFDDFFFVGVDWNEGSFLETLESVCEENDFDIEFVDVTNFMQKTSADEAEAYFMYWDNVEGCVWRFEMFNEIAEWAIEFYLKDIIDLDSTDVETELDWFLDIQSESDSILLEMESREYQFVKTCLKSHPDWMACAEVEKWDF
jgi:hypothetical protein